MVTVDRHLLDSQVPRTGTAAFRLNILGLKNKAWTWNLRLCSDDEHHHGR